MDERLGSASGTRFGRMVEAALEGILILAVISLAVLLIFPSDAFTAPSFPGGDPAAPGGMASEGAAAAEAWVGKVSAGVDDGFARPLGGTFKNRYDREYIRLRPGSWGGLRFRQVEIPQGARIQEAFLRLYISGKDHPSILLYGEIGLESPDFSELNPVARSRTSAFNYWQKHNIGDGWHETPSLVQIIQEIVNQRGWSAGSPLVMMLESTAGSLRFNAWEKDPVTAAELHVVYEGEPNIGSNSTSTPQDRAEVTWTQSAPTQAYESTETPTATPSLVVIPTDTPVSPTESSTPTQISPTATENPPTATSSPTVPATQSPTPTAGHDVGPFTAFSGPVQINASNYDAYHGTYQSIGPFIVRAVALDVSRYERGATEIERIRDYGEDVVDYRMGFGSVALVEQLLESGEAERLKALGVSSLTYNPEGKHTPEEEFSLRFDASAQNPIVRFARLADNYGFRAIWAPLRADADRIGDEALALIYSSGLDGLALQEQRFIENACVDTRTEAVEATFRRHTRIAGRPIELTVQIMSSRCSNGDAMMASCGEGVQEYTFQHCDLFVDALTVQSTLDVLAIWPTGNEAPLIETLR